MTRHEAQQAPAELVCADRRRHRRQQIEGLEPLWSEERDDQHAEDRDRIRKDECDLGRGRGHGTTA